LITGALTISDEVAALLLTVPTIGVLTIFTMASCGTSISIPEKRFVIFIRTSLSLNCASERSISTLPNIAVISAPLKISSELIFILWVAKIPE